MLPFLNVSRFSQNYIWCIQDTKSCAFDMCQIWAKVVLRKESSNLRLRSRINFVASQLFIKLGCGTWVVKNFPLRPTKQYMHSWKYKIKWLCNHKNDRFLWVDKFPAITSQCKNQYCILWIYKNKPCGCSWVQKRGDNRTNNEG